MLVGEPDDAPIFQNPLHNAVQRSAQRLDSFASREIRRFNEFRQSWRKTRSIEYAGNVVGRQRCTLPPARRRQLREYGIRQGPCDLRKGIAVEKEERCLAMKGAEPVQSFEKGPLYLSSVDPVSLAV